MRARRIEGRAFGQICDVLARAVGAARAVIADAAHGPQLRQPEAFNGRLRALLDSASKDPPPDTWAPNVAALLGCRHA